MSDTELADFNQSWQSKIMGVMKQGYVVAIDGPAGSGKSSITKALAQRINFRYIDTGALYRAIGLFVLRRVPVEHKDFLSLARKIAKVAHFEFSIHQRLIINAEDVTDLLRSEEVGYAASLVSTDSEVRLALVGLQRHLGCQGDSILEGRDIGTVIFPDADLKIFLTASLEQRAQRRLKELGSQKPDLLLKLKQQMYQRDLQDSTREYAPLRKAKDAVEIDTTYLTFEEVVEKIEILINQLKK